ncbi:MAG: hypothetical protein IKR63_06810 [Alloprevotella sp.]|nr:hypothetical protein [Alloprevotella sp.]
MKKYLLYAVALCTAMTFTACGDDDDEGIDPKKPSTEEPTKDPTEDPQNKPDPTKTDAAVEAGLCPDANHPHAIDMGYAGKWACCNVGATNPFEYGGYYAWGETKEKDDYSKETYKYSKNGKYYVDIGFDISGSTYDVAAAKWGGTWKMPANNRIDLLFNCSGEYAMINGVIGWVFKATNGNRIFLPAAGYLYETNLRNAGKFGDYWTSNCNIGYLADVKYGGGYGFHFNSVEVRSFSHRREEGLPVRPVAD